jgi:hypothetical protein
MTEMQMMLHEHPVNQSREARGEPAVNGTWFWGGGVMPKSIVSPYTHLWSNELLTESLAVMSGTRHANLPFDANPLFQSSASGHHLVVLDVLHGKAQYADAMAGVKLEKPRTELVRAVSRAPDKVSGSAVVTTLGGAKTMNFTIRGAWKFWRRL